MPDNEVPANKVEMSQSFKMTFIVVVGFTLIFLYVSFSLSSQQNLTPSQGDLINTCSTLVKLGFGAIVGLIGGKQI